MNDKISDKDIKAWENFITSEEKLPNKDLKLNKKRVQHTKRIDLHGFTIEDANSTVERFILESFEAGISKITIVTGKGLHSNVEKDPYVSKDLSILKYSVPEYIKKSQELMNKIIEIKDAEIKDGGTGAFYIILKKKL